MRFKTHLNRQSVRIDMIPLINCLFLLNIFFLLSSSVVFQPGIRVDMPVISRKFAGREANELFITLTKQGKIFLAEKPSTWEGLKLRLRTMHKTDPSRVIVIKADSGLPHESVARTLAYAQGAGFVKISLAVAVPQESQVKNERNKARP